MNDKAYKIVDMLFFGAGKRGQYWVRSCKAFGIVPIGVLDSDKKLSGQQCEGIMIHHPNELGRLRFAYICITCSMADEIYRQLLTLGVPESKIVVGDHELYNLILHYAVSEPAWIEEKAKPGELSGQRKILFDLHNGMVLGGVEAWVYGLAKNLKEKGYNGLYLATDASGPSVLDKTFPVTILKYSEIFEEKARIEQCVYEIEKSLPCTVVCNFPWNIFWAACIVKRLYPDLIRIVAVQHNDDQSYYKAYSLWQDYIDKCLVISSRIERKLLSFGMDKRKLCRLEWKVACEEQLDRTWSEEETGLQIGYAGRVTARQKRVDLLPELADELRRRGICFRMNIAGTGNYSDVLQQRIIEEKLQDCVVPLGYIDRKDVSSFWSRQDIMISCSEWEGHSISQVEAMAGGAVPILTDVSGATDDVTDGYNGYIVEVGDVDGLAKRICRLYHDRDMLARLGKNAHDTVYHRQAGMDQAAFWDRLLKEIWQSPIRQ